MYEKKDEKLTLLSPNRSISRAGQASTFFLHVGGALSKILNSLKIGEISGCEIKNLR